MAERLGLRLTGRLALLAASMRAAGARVGVDALVAAHRALAVVDPADRSQAYFALRPALCSRHDDFLVFDAAFAEWFGAGTQSEPPDDVAQLVLTRVAVPSADGPPPPAAEQLRAKDFAEYTDAERVAAWRIMRRLTARRPLRPRPAPRRGARPPAARPDLRRTLRASLRHDGEPLQRHWREPAERPRPLVLVCDVSGSMQPYARMLLQYVQACAAARRRVEAFVFETRLTRVTAELRGRDPDRALELAAAVAGWSAGPRIGDALAELNREHGRRIGRGAIVVVLSDGCDRGDPVLLECEAARLHRCAHRLVWLNPLKAQPGYEPLARGMRAVLPHVDRFMAGNSLQSFEQLALVMDGGFE